MGIMQIDVVAELLTIVAERIERREGVPDQNLDVFNRLNAIQRGMFGIKMGSSRDKENELDKMYDDLDELASLISAW